MSAVPHSSKCDPTIMKSDKGTVCHSSNLAHSMADSWYCGSILSIGCPNVLVKMCHIVRVFMLVYSWSAEHCIHAKPKLYYILYIANHAMDMPQLSTLPCMSYYCTKDTPVTENIV